MKRKIRYAVKRAETDEELKRYGEIIDQAFPGSPFGKDESGWIAHERPEDFRIAVSGRTPQAGLMIVRCAQWFGGRSVPMWGIRGVATAPEARGLGAASTLMVAALREMHDNGIPLSTLYPATHTLYRRSGYELAGTNTRYKYPVSLINSRERTLAIETFDPDDYGVMKRAYAERAGRTNGHMDRNDWSWMRVSRFMNEKGRGFRVAGDSGETEGYFVLRYKKVPFEPYDLVLDDLVVLTPRAGRRILAFCADYRSMAINMIWKGSPVEPLEHIIGEVGQEIVLHDEWMLRVVDAKGALEARGYNRALDSELHFELSDDLLPWNSGRFVLDVSGGRGTVRKGGRGALRMKINALAPLYTGYMAPEELCSAGLIDGSAGELSRAALIFAGPRPWMTDNF